MDLQPDAATALREGNSLRQAGDMAGALESYEWAVEHSRPSSSERGEALIALADLETDLGRYADAMKRAHAAASVFQALGDSMNLALAFNRAGRAALYGGDYRQAEDSFEAGAALSHRTGHIDSEAEQLANLGNVHFFTGRYADAARLYDQALALTRTASAMPWAIRRRRIVLANQASLAQRLGRDQEALAVYQELGNDAQALRPGERAQLLSNLGVLYRRLGDPLKALQTYDEARSLLAHDHQVDSELNVLKNRGIVLALDLGRFDEAEQNFTEALGIATRVGNRREMLHAYLYRGEAGLRARHVDRAREDFTTALALARELRTPEEEWKALYGLARVDPGGEEATRNLTEAVSRIEEVRERIRVPTLLSDFFNDKRQVYDALIAARIEHDPTDAIFNILEHSHSRLWRDRLGLATSLDLAAVQRALPEGVLLLDYWQAAAGSAVLAVSRTRAETIRLKAEDSEISALINALAAGPPTEWRPLAAATAAKLLPPAEWFHGIDHVIIVPDGAVALVPFDVLPIDGRLLVERAAVTYTPTAATLLRKASAVSGRRAPWRLELRAFADPLFASAGPDESQESLPRLTASADEAREVASQLTGRAALHLGSDNRKAYLLAATEQAPILHIATHAFADGSALERSRILFSPAQGSGARADYLFLGEAYGLPLEGVELAILSACDTARGRLVRGEGVQSFSHAFLASGARSTITTLWHVGDRPTENFMQVLYHHLQQGTTRDEALRRAKLQFLHSGLDVAAPHVWAAFVLTGDGLRPVPRAVSWYAIMVVVLVLATLVAMAVRRWQRANA